MKDFVVISIFLLCSGAVVTVVFSKAIIDGADWQCTQEAVVKDVLPKKYQCVQWTKGGK